MSDCPSKKSNHYTQYLRLFNKTLRKLKFDGQHYVNGNISTGTRSSRHSFKSAQFQVAKFPNRHNLKSALFLSLVKKFSVTNVEYKSNHSKHRCTQCSIIYCLWMTEISAACEKSSVCDGWPSVSRRERQVCIYKK